MPRRTLAAVAAALALAALARPTGAEPAHDPAQRFPVWGAAIKAATSLAVRHWGLDPCGGRVVVSWARMDPGFNAKSGWDYTPGTPDDPRTRTNCTLALNDAVPFDWPKLCTIVMHEYGHLTGHPHSGDPHDVMSPYYSEPAAPCAAAPEPRGARLRRALVRAGGVTVAVACAGRHRGAALHGLRACHVGGQAQNR